MQRLEVSGVVRHIYVIRRLKVKRDVKMPCKQVSFSIGALLENLGALICQDCLSEKDSASGLLSWTQSTLRFLTWGPSGTLVKGQGSPELISDYGAQGAIRPRCMGGCKGSNPMQIYLSSLQNLFLPICCIKAYRLQYTTI
jgi:hypothetical protein